jgi:hypothetical protein
MCGAPAQAPELPAYVDVTKETVIYGVVSRDGAPVPAAYVRLLDASGEFTAEVVTSATGDFRFYAAQGGRRGRARTRGGVSRPQLIHEGLSIVAQYLLDERC